jgi:hypothetical protein
MFQMFSKCLQMLQIQNAIQKENCLQMKSLIHLWKDIFKGYKEMGSCVSFGYI